MLAGLSILAAGLLQNYGFAGQHSPPANRHALVLQEFQTRVAQYVKLRNKIEASLPPLKTTTSPTKLNAHQDALAQRIRAARRSARRGSIFTPAISREFRRLIALAMRGSARPRVRSSLREARLGEWRTRVNEVVPKSAPLRTMPPTLLLNLPKLPPQLDYRFVGRDLILRDAEADLVLDFIPAAAP